MDPDAEPGTVRGNADMATMEPRGTTVTNANVLRVAPGGDND